MNLLERLKSGFSTASGEVADPEHDVQIAAAVLLLAIEHADNEHTDDERIEIVRQLQDYFQLDADEVDTLIAAAEPRAEAAVSLHRFLQELNNHLDYAQKRRVLEMLWRVAYADQSLDVHEEVLMREIAELLYLPHSEFIKSKLAVTDEGSSD